MSSSPFSQAAPLLAKYPRVPAREIAQQVGVHISTVNKWIRLLGIHHVRTSKLLHQREGGHCESCGILLSAAVAMDGKGNDTTCAYCLAVKAGEWWRVARPSSMRDPIVAVCETLERIRCEIGEGI